MCIRVSFLLLALGLSTQLAAQGLSLSISQPSGPGSFEIQVGGATAGSELYNLVSLVPVSPTGSGPIFGLGLADAGFLLDQLLTPLGTDPFHVAADGSGAYLWGFTLSPAGLTLDADCVAIEWSPLLGAVDTSPVVFASLSL